MAKVTFKTPRGSALSKIAKSQKLGDVLEGIATPVLEAARRDPNDEYVDGLRMVRHVSSGRLGRISVRVGAAPVIGARVEAKRGTLRRALSSAGL